MKNTVNKLISKIESAIAFMKTPRGRKYTSIGAVGIIILWTVFRFSMIGIEHARVVFNASRDAAENGVPVVTITMSRTSGDLREPIAVKDNRAYVSSGRINKFGAGQHVGSGVIVSVSGGIDLDSGMHIIRTRGVADGLQYAQYRATGYFVPVYAINNGVVMVADGDVARTRNVRVGRQDAENALVESGLRDGDIVILTRVSDGDKIQIKQ